MAYNACVSEAALQKLREGTRATVYEGRLFLVGGFVRDRLLGRPFESDDIDLVLEGDAIAVARFLWERRIARHPPVTFESFGTAMVHVDGTQVELVTARAETYRHGSRKPIVRPGTLFTDAERRDFTVNTFLENLHTGERIDPLGTAYADLKAGILRTPLDPHITFTDDPLRMLRACRFAARLGFTVAPETEAALRSHAFRLSPAFGIAYERIRIELNKTLLAAGAADGLERMRDTGLLVQFSPELAAMHGVAQNRFHRFDVWRHTLEALERLPADASLPVRLAALFHDIGKPVTRTVDADGQVHFYEHETIGAEMTRQVLTRLRYSADEIRAVGALVGLHMRLGAYTPSWTDAAVRRLIRAVGAYRQDLFTLARADIAACNTRDYPVADLDSLSRRMEAIETAAHVTSAVSPLTGQEIMARLGLPAGPLVGRIKSVLTDAVVAGELAPDDREGAERLARTLILP